MIEMLRRGRTAVVMTAAAAAILLSACGGAGYGSTGSPSTHRPTAATAATVVGTDSIPGIGTVLDNSKGFTLYHLTTDTRLKTTCLDVCAQVWPPLLATTGALHTPAGVNGTLGTIHRPDGGTQVTFNGMPLYTYSGDPGPAQANGQGISGFYAVTP